MKILHICSEMYPLIKTGGLADVMGALPYAQQQSGNDVRVLIPLYPQVAEKIGETNEVATIGTFAGLVTIRFTYFNGLGVYVIDAPHLFQRSGNPYHDSGYADYPDNYKRFALLGYLGAQLSEGLDQWWGKADILHAHDWQGGLACAYLKSWNSPVKSVFTIHNIAYPGRFHSYHLHELGLPWHFFQAEGLEFYGEISYLKAGLYFADKITTVSPTYALEITEEIAGGGMHGLLQTRKAQGRLHGVLNGVDDTVWNPETDTNIVATYKPSYMQGKSKNKAELQQMFHLPEDKDAMLMVMVTRLTEQKGADFILDRIDELMEERVQLVVLGSGSPHLEYLLNEARSRHPEQIGIYIGYNEALSHQIIAGGDVILVPSRFEPCGLTQLYGLKYGTLPLVRRTGGLADTVVDSNKESIEQRTATGFVFNYPSSDDFLEAFRRAVNLWKKNKLWSSVRQNALAQDFGWARAAASYQAIYQEIV
ncbi:putative Glycogen synthase [Actinobacillus pleuropneumoniae]|uniref:Glycogen synthase n=6 Tax=Actinobacillus pleuropneumoniae TaxID=715 RepID=GLGA_ACTP2|nr:glycogen synthase GlgA [Actinobacillus pleuropneumoniae]A3MZ67.1 RecName: Full=Glycogen synthase; AltName: Full=Starch [bacterial glycogen] synthase [Actinobacillus pleuropneumoniae serovar 5b str. L20]B3H0J4.1 RecName: Full=Glycogen synthase; AltName: Full=Starch [bacterial glycogen] synthase [Actinobacillus pleuropneumoniae serovar 7 str. AP76]ABN73453.1 glycogen synthase [Actinobacillus pleuropneumoniae serovar 5b str. L20]ACE61006.1 glycogen synthase [Actinobacillus pleuropneumoniae sero